MNSTISGHFPRLVPVPNKGGTGTTYAEPKWYRYHDKVILVPLTRTKVVPVPRQSGTGTNLQNKVDTSIDPNGTGTTASYNPDFWYSYIIKLKFAHRGYRNPNK